MPKQIKLLPEKIINKIAAGEVVERPASVVKELVENAIDAKANRIKIEVKDAGKKLIKITDNGIGLSREDLLLAFERHATSKISDIHDLEKIKTLGFRGEALPSIAAVSKIKAQTKHTSSDTGFQIIIEGGNIKNITEIASQQGFSIEVKELFFNIPARKKFLKKNSTENFYIENVVKKSAISYPNIEWTYINNSKIKSYPAAKNLLKRIEQLYPSNVVTSLIPFTIEDEEVFMSGYVSPPDITSSNSYDVNIFLNGRFIRDRIVYMAIKDSFKGKIFDKKYPFIFLFIEIAPEKVDVNVHPAKLEVRFHNEKRIYNLLSNTLDTVLSQSRTSVAFKEKEEPEKLSKFKNFIKSSIDKYMVKKEENTPDDFFLFETEQHKENLEKEKFYTNLDYIGQLMETFIILTNKDSLFLLDQHAAHERVQMEKLKQDIDKNKNSSKKFLIPELLDLSEYYIELLEKYITQLNNLGFVIDKLDDKTFVVKGVPTILSEIDINEFLKVLLEEFKNKGASSSLKDINEKVIAVIACRSALKAGTRLDEKTVKYLLTELDNVPNNRTCPHGRPIIVEISKNEILTRFKRV